VHYVVLMTHLIGGSVAMIAATLQMWPWLRRTRPAVHRWVGRTYAYVGVIPGALASVALMYINGSWTGAIGSGLWATLWIFTAIAGIRAARRRRFADHRKWMIRGFALTLAIIWSRLIFDVVFRTGLETKIDFVVLGEFFGWGPWVAHLLVAQWWLDRTAKRPSSLQPA
jgi:FtsH-binding integral membrane protein